MHSNGIQNDFHVIIIGAGLGGAACAIACARQGLRVTLYDAVPEFFPLGDSVGFGSNTSKLFKRWGLYDDLWAISSRAEESVMRNFDGTIITRDPTLGQAEERYGHKGLIGHRGQYHAIFIEQCRKNNVDVKMGVRIERYNVNKPSVFLPSGEEVTADAIIAADGVKSIGRTQVLGFEDAPIHSGYAVWRAYSDSATFKDDPLVSPFLSKDTTQLWIGPDLHGFVTTIRDGTEINAVLTHKDDADISEGWNVPGKREDILEALEGWDPTLRRVWEKIDNIIDWKLVYRPCLDKWVADSGLVAIAGDAAHPFLPTSTQGASQAVEDGATIALCLAKAGKGNVPLALHTYFAIRYEHVKAAQQVGISQRDKWHNIHDKSTLEMQEMDTSKGILDSYHLWAHDAEQAVENGWEEISARVWDQLKTTSDTPALASL